MGILYNESKSLQGPQEIVLSLNVKREQFLLFNFIIHVRNNDMSGVLFTLYACREV